MPSTNETIEKLASTATLQHILILLLQDKNNELADKDAVIKLIQNMLDKPAN